ncbi:MAG: cytochrome c maturation protein CcmE [Pseudomonadota bacterium]
MHPLRKQRLMLVVFVVMFSSAAIGLMAYALRGNINLFFPPTDVVAGKAPLGQPIRVGGMVVDGSVIRSADSLEVAFELTDFQSNVAVVYTGILPDLFDEGQGAVAAGTLNANGVLMASEVLAKHDENYMPPEVAEALEQAGFDEHGRAK